MFIYLFIYFIQKATAEGIQGRIISLKELLLTSPDCLILPLDPRLFGAHEVWGSDRTWPGKWHLAVLTTVLPSCLSIGILLDFNHLSWNFPFYISASHQTCKETSLIIVWIGIR